MRTANFFWTSARFSALAAWRERGGPFLLLPSLWVETGLERGLDVHLTRWTLAWGRRRCQLDWGHWQPRDPERQLDWALDGLDAFLVWANEVFAAQYTRSDLERLLQRSPELYRLIALGGAPAHYTQVMLVRGLQEQQRPAATAAEWTPTLPDSLGA